MTNNNLFTHDNMPEWPEDDLAVLNSAAKRALENGWISKAQYAEKIRYAHDWKRKAERGYWDWKSYKQGA